MSKRLSPLVATAILLLVSIAVGAGVMTWGAQYIEERAEFGEATGCEGISLALIGPDICFADGTITIFVENAGSAPASAIRAQLFGSDIATVQFDGIPAKESRRLSLTYDPEAIGTPRALELTPLSDGLCRMATLPVDEVPRCP